MRYALTLRSSGTDVRVTLTTSTLVGIEEGSVSGGWVVVRADAGDSTLVLADGDPSGSLSLAPPASGVTHA